MTKKEWMEYIEKTWDAAQREAWSEPQFECPRCGHCCQANKLETEQEPVAHVDHRIHGWPDCLVIKADPPDREDIIRMAREAGLADSNGVVHAFYQLEYFVYLVAEHEREAIWNLLFEYAGRDDLSDSDQSLLKHLLDLIAARWQEWSNKEGEES